MSRIASNAFFSGRTTRSILATISRLKRISPDLGNFFSNYEALTAGDARTLMEDTIAFDQFTYPMQQLIRESASAANGTYFVSSANPRIVEGKPSKNPRYLQLRPDLVHPRETHLAEIGARLRRRVPLGQALHRPVNAVLPGRRNNPPEGEIRPLAVFNPIHYLELPELFMEFICSVTGKSPSTTGAGSEGALTKGPFNALPPIIDLNAALVSYLLTGDAVFVTATGYVGPHFRVDHDISLLVPEIWSRMSVGGTRSPVPHFRRIPGAMRRPAVRRSDNPREPAWLPDHHAICTGVFRPDVSTIPPLYSRRRCSARNFRICRFSWTAWTTSSPLRNG